MRQVLWEKRGRIFTSMGSEPWMRSHASLPVALHLGGDVYRVYFASRDERNRSHVGFVEIDITRPDEPLSLAEEPVLAPGPLGGFDDHGVYPASLVLHDGRLLLYYIGWNPSSSAPVFYSTIGLAESDDGGLTFSRVSPAPILGRSPEDPLLVTSPCVLVADGRWRMWYVSGVRWEETPAGIASVYHVKHAESDDGLTWRRERRAAVALRPGETNLARPAVIREADGFRMWYSRNSGNGYRLGYAESTDGLVWMRHDEQAGIAPGPEEWDSQAVAYPSVFEHGGRKYLLYNGNQFGRDGFGLAVEADG